MTSGCSDGKARELGHEFLRAAFGVEELASHAGLGSQDEELSGCNGAELTTRDWEPDAGDARVEFREQHTRVINIVFAAKDCFTRIDYRLASVVEGGDAKMFELFVGELKRINP